MDAPLTDEQVSRYREDGFLVLRARIDEADLRRFERGLERNPPLGGAGKAEYPAAGRYTLAHSCLADPDLGFVAEHAGIVPVVEQLLGHAPRLTAFVVYDRTPGGPGLPAHHDYKRWRPVGSSMNWLFAIVPLCDFDKARGPVWVAPGSHRLERVRDTGERTLQVDPPVRPSPEEFIDPGLERGDLLLMNMHMWHKARGNHSDRHRVGIFNKYAAENAVPATGPSG